MRTWEKWYWGIDLTLMILFLIGYHTNTNPEYYTVTINNQPQRPATGTEVYISALIVFIGIAGLLWLIIRYFANKGDDKK